MAPGPSKETDLLAEAFVNNIVRNSCLQLCVSIQYVCKCTLTGKSSDYVVVTKRSSDQVYLFPGALVVPRPAGQVIHLSLIPDESC